MNTDSFYNNNNNNNNNNDTWTTHLLISRNVSF